jgi:hypothetical protein
MLFSTAAKVRNIRGEDGFGLIESIEAGIGRLDLGVVLCKRRHVRARWQRNILSTHSAKDNKTARSSGDLTGFQEPIRFECLKSHTYKLNILLADQTKDLTGLKKPVRSSFLSSCLSNQ